MSDIVPEQLTPELDLDPQPESTEAEPMRSAIPGITAESSLQEVLTAFQQHMKEEGFAVNTVKAFSSDVRLLGKYVGMTAQVGEMDTAVLNKFLNWLVYERGVSCSPKSYSRRVTTLKVLFSWLTEEGVLYLDPAEALVQMSVTSPLPSLPTPTEIERVTAVVKAWRTGHTLQGEKRKVDSRPQFLLELLLQTGMKKGEVVSLLVEHIERDDEMNPQIFVRYKNPRWRNKERRLPVDPEWVALFDEYRAQYKINDEVFPCTARNLEYVLRDVSDEAGLEPGLISFENLRWTSALMDMRAGMEPDLIRERLGISEVTWRETSQKLERLMRQVREREEAEATSKEEGEK